MLRRNSLLGLDGCRTARCEHRDRQAAAIALVEIDDWDELAKAHGAGWDSRHRAAVDRLVRAAGVAHVVEVPDAAWMVTIWVKDARRAAADIRAFAARLSAAANRSLSVQLSIAVSDADDGPDRPAIALRQALARLDDKLILDGARTFAGANSSRPRGAARGGRFERWLGPLLHDRDMPAAAAALERWVDAMAAEVATPAELRQCAISVLLYALDATATARAPSGSPDWSDALRRLPPDLLVSIFEVHERSVLVNVLRDYVKTLVGDGGRSTPHRNDLMARVEQHILAHYAEQLQLDDLARAVYLSPYYISRLFQRELGTTFLKYLTGVRMRHAQEMLASTSLPVDLIAHRVGYASARHFRTIFRRQHGCTPTDFRQHGRGTGPRYDAEALAGPERLAVSRAG